MIASDTALTPGAPPLDGWRAVPVRPGALGDEARATMPRIEQLVLQRPLGTSLDEAERRAYRARTRAEETAGAADFVGVEGRREKEDHPVDADPIEHAPRA